MLHFSANWLLAIQNSAPGKDGGVFKLCTMCSDCQRGLWRRLSRGCCQRGLWAGRCSTTWRSSRGPNTLMRLSKHKTLHTLSARGQQHWQPLSNKVLLPSAVPQIGRLIAQQCSMEVKKASKRRSGGSQFRSKVLSDALWRHVKLEQWGSALLAFALSFGASQWFEQSAPFAWGQATQYKATSCQSAEHLD